MDNPGIAARVDQQRPRRLRRQHKGLSHRSAGPRDRRHLRPPIHHYHADIVPPFPLGGAEAPQIGRGHLKGREGRARSTVRTDQAIRGLPHPIHHPIDSHPFGAARNPQRQRLNEKGRLLLRQQVFPTLLRHRATGFYPYLLLKAILPQQATVKDSEVVDTLRLVVNIQRQDIKVEAISAGMRISRQRVQKAANEGGIAPEDIGPVRYAAQVNDSAGVGLPGYCPGHAQELGEIRG